VGAPIFYRDVPFMPILNDEKGIILPLDNFNMKYIKWRMRDISRRESKVVLDNMPTCANCHTFSRDGGWLGMDIDGTQGDKGAYGIQKVTRNMVYKRENIVSWNYDFKEKKSIKPTFGFLSSMAPDGEHVVSTVEEELFVVGYLDQAFLQVFYPTRGILAYYSKKRDEVKSLPGANDWDYVHCSPTWTPDGKEIIFSRAKAKDPFTRDQKMPAKANDPEETEIQYDLYRMPFNNGRGGKAVPVKGASFNGKSNNFAKVSPDGKWIVWVQCRNGLLMRPDSKLWIVPARGGGPRLMKCNTWRMNSWHSWSPNSRWLVFSSKKNTIYTQMFLTHIDENGMDSPPILIPNSTADNRAVNIPEFMNSSYDSLDRIDVPAISHFRYRIKAKEYIRDGFPDKAVGILQRGLQEENRDRLMRAEMMAMIGEVSDNPAQSIKMLRDAIAVDPEYSASWFMLGSEFKKTGKEQEAIRALKKSIQIAPDNFLAMVQLVKIYLVSQNPKIHDIGKALEYALEANKVTYYQKAYVLQNLARVYSANGQLQDAIKTAELAIQRAEEKKNWPRAEKIKNELRGYRKGMNFLSFIKR
jgi:Tfp pilus assembly protein PilF